MCYTIWNIKKRKRKKQIQIFTHDAIFYKRLDIYLLELIENTARLLDLYIIEESVDFLQHCCELNGNSQRYVHVLISRSYKYYLK